MNKVEDCRTPTYPYVTTPKATADSLHFKFPSDGDSCFSNVDRMKNISAPLQMRSRRSFTPIKNSFVMPSPEISPIEFIASSYAARGKVVRLPPEKVCKVAADSTVGNRDSNFLVPMTPERYLPAMREGPTASYRHTHFVPIDKNYYDDADRSIYSYKSPSAQFNNTATTPQNLDQSAAHGYLNHNLNLSQILANNNLGKYVPMFEREEIDFEIFLALKEKDLIRLGISGQKDRDRILEVIRDFDM